MPESKDTAVKKPGRKPAAKKSATSTKSKATTVKKPRKKTEANEQMIQAEIAKKAYELYEQSGRQNGKDVEHWLEAENLLKTKPKRKKAAQKK
jgi:hypothetical protein